MSMTISIPISIFTWPFKTVFALVRFALVVAFLATGVGAIIGMATKGFSRRYIVTQVKQVTNDCPYTTGYQHTVSVVSGWVLRLLGLRSKTSFFYSTYERAAIWLNKTGAPVGKRVAYKLEAALGWYQMWDGNR